MSTTKKLRVSSQSRNRRVSLGATYTILVVLGIIWLVCGLACLWVSFKHYNKDNTRIKNHE